MYFLASYLAQCAALRKLNFAFLIDFHLLRVQNCNFTFACMSSHRDKSQDSQMLIWLVCVSSSHFHPPVSRVLLICIMLRFITRFRDIPNGFIWPMCVSSTFSPPVSRVIDYYLSNLSTRFVSLCLKPPNTPLFICSDRQFDAWIFGSLWNSACPFFGAR